MKAITENDSDMTENYCSFLNELWTLMLNMQFMKKKKKIRKDHINHFCFILNKTFLFTSKKNQTNQGFILLLKIICSLLKVSWVIYICYLIFLKLLFFSYYFMLH